MQYAYVLTYLKIDLGSFAMLFLVLQTNYFCY